MPQEPSGITTLARMVRPGQRGLDYFSRWSPSSDGTICEMIYWERPGGGRLFHAGAIAAGWALSADPNFQTLMRNVLFHFGIKSL